MNSISRNCFKRIFVAQQRKNRQTIIGVLISAVIIPVAVCIFIFGTYSQILVTDTGSTMLHGISGLKTYTDYVHQHAGILDTETWNDYLTLYRETAKKNGNDKAVQACEAAYPGIGVMLAKLYFGNLLNSAEEADTWDFGRIPNANDIGKRVEESIMSYFYGSQFLYSAEEEAFAEHRAGEIGNQWQQGFIYDSADHWMLYIQARAYVMFFLTVLGIFLAASIFTQDKSNGMDQILSTVGTKHFHMASLTYLLTGMAALVGAWLLSTGILSAVLLLPFSYCDWNVPLQTAAPDLLWSPYNWTMRQYYGKTLIGSLVMLLCIYVLCSAIAAVCKDFLPALAFDFLAAIMPTAILMFTSLQENKIYFHFAMLMPLSNLVDPLYLTSYGSYGIGRWRLDSHQFSLCIGFFVIAAGFHFVPGLYARLLRK